MSGTKRKRGQAFDKHPYLSGNFAPIQQILPLTPCSHVGDIPSELAGGEYVRNGGNPVSNEDLGRDAHWFDGDGMLSGVLFRRTDDGNIQPEFVNQYILTDLFLATSISKHTRKPILPSIATLVNPLSTLLHVTLVIFRTLCLVLLSFLPGSRQSIKKISVANTSVVYHNGRALATCESGPPMRIALPGLETVGWYDGIRAGNEPEPNPDHPSLEHEQTLGGGGLLGFMREWTTAHPKVDPESKEMFLFHSCFAPPYVQYSVIQQDPEAVSEKHALPIRLLNRPVPGITSAKMMHDFGVSKLNTVIMDLPLSLDPLNLAKNRAPVEYDTSKNSRFGVFPRYSPHETTWFEAPACCIFHVANTWDVEDARGGKCVRMLTCRLTSSTVVFSAGNIIAPLIAPKPTMAVVAAEENRKMPFFSKYGADVDPDADALEAKPLLQETIVRLDPLGEQAHNKSGLNDAWVDVEGDQCRLYFYEFSLESSQISSQYALAAIPFEFPSTHPDLEMSDARYIYGCSTSGSSFGAALGKAAKIDILVKIDAASLIKTGETMKGRGQLPPVTGCVDQRSLSQVLGSREQRDSIKAFEMPAGWFAQEPRFVPRSDARSEDDGFLLTYAFDESQLDGQGEVPNDDMAGSRSKSELWIIDALDMKTLVARVSLPQRVPYGLHGAWFSEKQILGQRAIEKTRSLASVANDTDSESGVWWAIRDRIEYWLG